MTDTVGRPATDTALGLGPGRVEAIHIAPASGAPVQPVARIRAIAGIGLEGDRYALRVGTYSNDQRVSRDLTLIQAEVLEDLRDTGIELEPGATRRNVTTRGIALNELVGRRFTVGRLECRGTRLCEPCAYLEGLLGQPVLGPLVHRGGLRAEILSDGEIAVGDPILVLED